MPARVSEAIVLQTYPLKESDLVVSFLTRDQGKLRGVAKRARRPKSAFGSGLERLSQVKVAYFQNPVRELVNLDRCELVQSNFGLMADYSAWVALDYFAEISEQLLPPAEPNERYFRLLIAVLDHLRSREPGSVWRAVTYFTLWAVRLGGFLPPLRVSEASRSIAEEMLRTPVSELPGDGWQRETAADLRRFLVRQIENHIERKLVTAPALEAA